MTDECVKIKYGYSGCCCECRYKHELVKTPTNHSESEGHGSFGSHMGWICLNPEMNGKAVFFDRLHGICECFKRKED